MRFHALRWRIQLYNFMAKHGTEILLEGKHVIPNTSLNENKQKEKYSKYRQINA